MRFSGFPGRDAPSPEWERALRLGEPKVSLVAKGEGQRSRRCGMPIEPTPKVRTLTPRSSRGQALPAYASRRLSPPATHSNSDFSEFDTLGAEVGYPRLRWPEALSQRGEGACAVPLSFKYRRTTCDSDPGLPSPAAWAPLVGSA